MVKVSQQSLLVIGMAIVLTACESVHTLDSDQSIARSAASATPAAGDPPIVDRECTYTPNVGADLSEIIASDKFRKKWLVDCMGHFTIYLNAGVYSMSSAVDLYEGELVIKSTSMERHDVIVDYGRGDDFSSFPFWVHKAGGLFLTGFKLRSFVGRSISCAGEGGVRPEVHLNEMTLTLFGLPEHDEVAVQTIGCKVYFRKSNVAVHDAWRNSPAFYIGGKSLVKIDRSAVEFVRERRDDVTGIGIYQAQGESILRINGFRINNAREGIRTAGVVEKLIGLRIQVPEPTIFAGERPTAIVAFDGWKSLARLGSCGANFIQVRTDVQTEGERRSFRIDSRVCGPGDSGVEIPFDPEFFGY